MGDDQADAIRQLIPVLRGFAEAQVKSGGRESTIPEWLKWTAGLFVSIALASIAFTNLRRDTDDAQRSADRAIAMFVENERKNEERNAEAHKRLDRHIKRESVKIRVIYRKLDLPDPPEELD